MIKQGIIATMTLILLAGCTASNFEVEMESYCQCRSDVQESSAKAKECLIIFDDLITKYEYDPDILDEINKRITDCGR